MKVPSPKLDSCMSPGSQDEKDDGDQEITMADKKDDAPNDFILNEESNSQPKPFIILRDDKKKKRKSIHKEREEPKEEITGNRREKTSARIQNLKTQQLYSNISLEYILSNFTFKNDLKFDDLIEMYKDDFLDFNNIKSDEDILSLHPPVRMVEEYDGLNSMLMCFSQDQKAGSNDTDRMKERLTKASNNDFLQFLKENHNKKFANVILFAQAVLRHFLENKKRDLPRDLEEIPFFIEAKDSLRFCPSYHLTDYKKKMIIKIYLYCHHFCENLITDYHSKITLFEILVDYYYFKTSSTVKESEMEKHNQIMKRLRAALSNLSQSLLFNKLEFTLDELDEAQSSLLKVRSILAFAKFFLTEDFKCSTSAKRCLQLLGQELESLDRWMNLNTQMITNNIYVNMFWMKDKLLMSDHLEALEDKIKQNDLKESVFVQQQEDNLEKHDTEEKSAFLEGLFKIFEDKVKISLDSAVENHYKKLYQKISALKLNDFVLYLDKLFRVLLELMWQSNENEDSRKVLVHAYHQLKIKELLGVYQVHLEKPKRLKKLIDKDENFTFRLANIANYLYRMIVINYVIDYMLDFDLFLSLFVKTGHILVKKLGSKEPVVSQVRFFRLFHWLIHLVPSDKASRYHTELVKNSDRQDTTLKGLNWLKEQYGSYSAEEDKKKDDSDDEEVDIKELIEEEIRDIFACWYGIGAPSDKENKDKENQQKVKNFKDVVIFFKFLEYFYPENLADPTSRFKVVISRVLIDIYDYLKDNQKEWWDLCTGFKTVKQRFDKKLDGGNGGEGDAVRSALEQPENIEIEIPPELETHTDAEPEQPRPETQIEQEESHSAAAHPDEITGTHTEANDTFGMSQEFQPVPNAQTMEVEQQLLTQYIQEDKMEEDETEETLIDLNTDNCFCDKKDCFNIKHLKSRDVKQTFSQIFFFIGKALDDTKPATEGSDPVKQRKILLRIEKMYSISASFFPQDLYMCNALASTLLEQYILYSDQLVYDKVYEKFTEFEDCIRKARNLLASLIEKYDNHNFTIFFKDIKAEDVYAKILSNFKSTKLLQLFEHKFKLHVALLPSELGFREREKAQIDLLKQELKNLPINPAYAKDFYLSGTMILSSVPKLCSFKEHQSLVTNLLQLYEMFESSLSGTIATQFDKNLLPLYELETETHLFVMLYKIFKRYLRIIKYLYNDTCSAKIQQQIGNLPNGFNTLDKVRKYILNDFNEFISFLEKEKTIKFQLRRMMIDGKTSVDKAAVVDENNSNRVPLDMAANEENNELANVSGFLANYVSQIPTDEEIEHQSKQVFQEINECALNCLEEERELPNVTEVIKSTEEFIVGIAKKLREISLKKETKKFRGATFHTKCHLSSARIFEEYFADNKKAQEIILQLLTGKCNEVVELYKYEKDSILSLVYSRDLFFLRNKHKIIKAYVRLSYKHSTKESYEKCKFLSKKASGLILIPDKDKKNEKVNLVYQKLYELTNAYILSYLENNVNSIDSEPSASKETMQEENHDAQTAWVDIISENYKTDLKFIYEMIGTNIRSRNVAPIIKKNEELYNKLAHVVTIYYEKIAAKYNIEVDFQFYLNFLKQYFR